VTIGTVDAGFQLFSCISIFFVSMGDHLHQLIPSVSATTHMTIVSGISMIPTILLRTPALLSYLSMVGTVATIAVVVSVVSAGILEGDIVSESNKASPSIVDAAAEAPPSSHHCVWDPRGLPLAFGLVVFCFSGHAIVPSIYTSMKEPQRFESMVTLTFSIVVTCCLAVGVAGYHMFGDSVEDQVTLSLEQTSKANTAMTALTWLMVLTGTSKSFVRKLMNLLTAMYHSTAFSKVTLTMFPLALGFEEIFTPYLTTESMVNAVSGCIKFVLTAMALFVSVYVPSFSYLWYVWSTNCITLYWQDGLNSYVAAQWWELFAQ
jgi:solute carrier family 32 (vesicular inhibitory amino acid transporter)